MSTEKMEIARDLQRSPPVYSKKIPIYSARKIIIFTHVKTPAAQNVEVCDHNGRNSGQKARVRTEEIEQSLSIFKKKKKKKKKNSNRPLSEAVLFSGY